MSQKIIILDFGSQTTQLIGRRIREMDTFCEILPYNKYPEDDSDVIGVILSGSPYSVHDPEAFKVDLSRFVGRIPVLGICYGAQFISHTLGGKVEKANTREYGRAHLEKINLYNPLFKGFDRGSQVWMSHGDTITAIPEGFETIASTADVRNAAYWTSSPTGKEVEEAPVFAVQFHPEVYPRGLSHHPGHPLAPQFRSGHLRQPSGVERSLVRGDNGCRTEAATRQRPRNPRSFRRCRLFRLCRASQQGHRQPPHMYLRRPRHAAQGRVPQGDGQLLGQEGAVKWLAQGTIYPDRIESLNITGKVIKSHHNVGGLPEEMHLQLCEPLKWLFKDEVRRVGYQLDMPESLIKRHPFPGPGLAVRILGEITPEKVRVLQEADDIFIEGLHTWMAEDGQPLYDHVWQAGAVLLSTVRSVGVMGDERTYENPVALRAVTSMDAMTADWAHLPYEFLAKVSNEIINKVRGVNRVCYDISSKPPATIEWE